jgi:two-component system OmpR family response regulator
MRAGAVSLDARAGRVLLRGEPVKLTAQEFRVLSYLLHHRGRVISQGELTEHLYAADADRDSNTVEVFIARLRRKLGAAVIETVRGLGYRVDAS